MSFFKMDHWRCAIVHAQLSDIMTHNNIEGNAVTWLPNHGKKHSFSDPFGMWHENLLYVFVKSYDYRTSKGSIDVLIYNNDYSLLDHKTVLQESWNLSYPQIIKHEGSFYLLPEAHESGNLSLYRAVNFPYQWERCTNFDFPIGAIDATPLHYKGRWWLFWTPPTPKAHSQSALHIALAEDLTGAWCDMGCVWFDRSGARPAGTPVVSGDDVILPVKDSSNKHGGLQTLRIIGLGEGRPRIENRGAFPLPEDIVGSYSDGMNTLSEAGEVTLVDFKKTSYGISHKISALRNLLKK